MYVELPGAFNDRFYNSWEATCSVYRWKADWSGVDTATNFRKNCSYAGGRRVKFYLVKDGDNANAATAY